MHQTWEWADWPRTTQSECPFDDMLLDYASANAHLPNVWAFARNHYCRNTITIRNSIGGNAIWLKIIRKGERKKLYSRLMWSVCCCCVWKLCRRRTSATTTNIDCGIVDWQRKYRGKEREEKKCEANERLREIVIQQTTRAKRGAAAAAKKEQ